MTFKPLLGQATTVADLDTKLNRVQVLIRNAFQAVPAAASAAAAAAPPSTALSAVQGDDIPDADTTVDVTGGSRYALPVASASRVITLDTPGSPLTGQKLIVDVLRTDATTVTFKDDAGTTLLVVPASVFMTVEATFDGTHFANATAVRIQGE